MQALRNGSGPSSWGLAIRQVSQDDTTSGSGQVQPSSAAPAMTSTFAAEASSPAPVTTRTVEAEASLPATVRTPAAEAGAGLQGWAVWLLRNYYYIVWLCRLLGPARGQSQQVRYPWPFRIYLALVLIFAVSWVANYALVVSPAIEAIDSQPCTNADGSANDYQLGYNANMLFVYFVWFAVARTSLFMPCIASRIATVQSRTHGFCRTYCVHLILKDGPLYILIIGSMLFWFHLLQNPYCEHKNPLLFETLRLYAMYSCLISILCMLLSYWHNKLLMEATRSRLPSQDRGAPPGMLEKLETRAYDEALFGDEEGKPYPSDCAICLGTWEEDDMIKVTPCGHAFHEECLGGWFRNSRTCALCRQDCSRTPASSDHSFDWRMSSPRPRAIGVPTDGAAAAASSPGNATTSSNNTPGSLTVVAEAAAVDEESDDSGVLVSL